MIRLLKADLNRLLRDRGIIIIALVLIAFCFISTGAFALIDLMMQSIPEEIAELRELFGMISAEVSQLMISTGAIGSMGLFTAIAVGLFNGADFKNFTVRNKITAGHSRDSIFFSAFIVNQIINLALFIVAALATFVFGAMMVEISFEPAFALDFFMTYLISAAFTAVMTFVSFVTKKTSWTILIGVLVAALVPSIFSMTASNYFSIYYYNLLGDSGNYGVLEWISRLNLFSMNTFISNLYNGSIDASFADLHGASHAAYVGWMYGNVALTSVVWGGSAAVGGMLLFRRTDIK